MTSTSSLPKPFPSYLLHAPFLSVKSPLTPSLQLLQRTLPPSPLYYLHPPPSTLPGSAPPPLSLTPSTEPISGRISTVYRATSPSGAPLVLKYSQDFLSLLKEADEVFVNLPQGVLPIPAFYGIFEGNVIEGQPKGMVSVMSDCGEPLPGGNFDSLTLPERQYLFDTLQTLHEIHFSHGSFSPSSVVVSPSTPPPDSSNVEVGTRRKLTLVGFSQAQWHLCEGPTSCKELVDAKQALGL